MPSAKPLIYNIEGEFLLLCAANFGQSDSGEKAAARLLQKALGTTPKESDINALVSLLDSPIPYPSIDLSQGTPHADDGSRLATPCMDMVEDYLAVLGCTSTSLEFKSWLCLMLSSRKG